MSIQRLMSMLNWCPIPTSADVDILLFLGCVSKIQHVVNIKLTSNIDLNQIFIFNKMQRLSDVMSYVNLT